MHNYFDFATNVQHYCQIARISSRCDLTSLLQCHAVTEELKTNLTCARKQYWNINRTQLMKQTYTFGRGVGEN